MLSTRSDNCIPFVYIFDIIFLFAAELEEPKIGISGKGLSILGDFELWHLGILLTVSQTTNFRLFQTERVCRRQFSG